VAGLKPERWFDRAAIRTAHAVGHPATFIVAVALALLWAASGPAAGWSNTWQLIANTGTTIVSFLMLFLIQNSQNVVQASQDRDFAAMQAKLDDLIRALPEADNRLRGIEKAEGGSVTEDLR
jgi:low affinity Fe/Cu permease